jgi:polysaccharide biosynthesis transport protein
MLEEAKQKPLKIPHLTDYYHIVRKHSRLVLSVLSLTIILTALFTFSMKPIYRATAKILIDRESYRSPLTGQQTDADGYMSQQMTFKTHFTMITSRPVLENVLDRINSTEASLDVKAAEKELPSSFISTVVANLGNLFANLFGSNGQKESVSPEEELRSKTCVNLKGKIDIEEVKDTRLLNIHVEDHDPQVARTIANAIAESYVLYDTGTRLDSSRRILDWLSRQLYEMKKKVEDAERNFQTFKEKEGIFSIEGKQKINAQKIEEISTDNIKMRSQLLEVEAKITEMKKFIAESSAGSIKNIPTFLRNELLEKLYAELLGTEVEYQRISGVYRHKHPEMVKVTSKISELRTKIHQQLQKALTNAESERAVLLAREKGLQLAMNGYESDAIGTNRKELQYAILERDLKTNQELYNTLLAKVKEASITDEITKSNLRIVEPAVLPFEPVKPRKVLNLALSVALGLATGVMLAFFLEYMDQTVHNKDDVQKHFHLPVLSVVPIQNESPGAAKKSKDSPVLSVLELPATSHFSEAFRMLATNLRFSEPSRSNAIYLVTSSTPQEGKSTVSLNLGLTMAKLGIRTLVIEADLRLPTMSKTLKLAERAGMTDVFLETFNTEVKQGELGKLTVGDLHQLLEIQERSGLLRYQNEKDIFTVSFLKGRMIDVDWQTRPVSERLGALLSQGGKITQEQLRTAEEKQESGLQSLGQVLLQLGFISVEDLAGPLRLLMQENMRKLCQCGHADFTFEQLALPAYSEVEPKEAALLAAVGNLKDMYPTGTPFLMKQICHYLYHVPDHDLWVLSSGKIPPNPTELLASKRMRSLMDILRRQFDTIIVDSPPVTTVSDTAILSSLCDGVIMVIRTGTTHIRQIELARDQLHAAHTPVMGVVLNMLDFERDPYHYGRYYQKYKGYYGKHSDQVNA